MKRSILLCIVVLALTAALILPSYAAVELYNINAATPTAPEFVQYTLNCPATVTVKIEQVKDAAGNPITPTVVKTATITETTKGKKTYVWPGTTDAGTAAPIGTYQAKVSAVATQADWNSVYGLFTVADLRNANPTTRPLPSVGDLKGPHGIGVNKNPNSPYYGCVYAGRQEAPKAVYMYGPDGKWIKDFEITSSTWADSAPWNLSVADDDYVYVSDRTNSRIYCFSPDGVLMSRSPAYVNFRGMGVRTDMTTGITHVFMTGTTYGVHHVTLNPDHVSWSPMPSLSDVCFNPGVSSGSGEGLFGMWISPDFSTIYQANVNATAANKGVTKWTKAPGTAAFKYTKADVAPGVPQVLTGKNIVGIDLSPDGQYLWAAEQTGYGTDIASTSVVEQEYRAIHKVNLATGTELWDGTKGGVGDYDIITWGLFCGTDAVGNIAVTFGKSTTTWSQYYWGLFAEPGTSSTIERTTGTFTMDADPRPVIVPGSEAWSNFSNTAYPDKLFPNGSATAKLTFRVIDAGGAADIGAITLNLTSLGGGAAVTPDTRTVDPGDATQLICTKNVSAVAGTFCGINTISGTVADVHGLTSSSTFSVEVAGSPMTGFVSHTYWRDEFGNGGLVENANIVMQGGKTGVAGYPFTYKSGATYNDGSGFMDVSEGNYSVWAERVGFKSEAPRTGIVIPAPAAGGPGVATNVGRIAIGPITIAECRNMFSGTIVSVQGVCFAQPKGVAPTAAYGMDIRTQATPQTNVLDKRQSFYLCDPGNAAAGMQFAMKQMDLTVAPYTWDDPNAGDPDLGVTYYVGKRPAIGDTIVVTGSLGYLGYERRVMCADTWSTVPNYRYNFVNRGVVVGNTVPTPVAVTVADVEHAADSNAFNDKWGKYATLSNATFVYWRADGKQMFNGEGVVEPVPYAVMANPAGNWCSVTFESPTSLNIPVPTDYPANPPTAMSVGNTYTITGATSRRTRFTEGTMRPRSSADIVQTSTTTDPGADTVANVRDVANGGAVNVRGIITAYWSSAPFFYIESTDRSVGIRVKGILPVYLQVGDDVQVIGTVNVENGERVITPTTALIPRVPHLPIQGQTRPVGPLPAAFAMPARDFGGAAYDDNNPGIENGRGANNIGLRVKLGGLVTFKDPGNTYYYIWDGSNAGEYPVSDSTGNRGVRVMASTTAVPWTQWVEVTGIASTSKPGSDSPVIPTLRPTATAITSVATGFDSITKAEGEVLTAEWNLIAFPSAPAGIGPGNPDDPKPWDPPMTLSPNLSPDDIDSRLFRFEASNQSMYGYDQYMAEGWGGTVVGDGYWLRLDAAWPITLKTKIHTLDAWGSIPSNGWILTGHAKTNAIELANCAIHDGKSVKSITDAAYTEGWIMPVGYWFDSASQSMLDIGLPDEYPSTTTLQPWHGYWFQVNSANKALLIPDVDSPIVPAPAP